MTGASAAEPTLSVEEFRALRDVVATAAGLDLPVEQLPSVQRRLRERLPLLGVETFGEYVRLLRSDPSARGELESALELLTTNETYFMREAYQLRAFRDEALPMLADLASARRRISVWSAGCSTGEEVYSLAILLLEAQQSARSPITGYEVRIFGSDLSKRCLAQARRAIYGPSAFRATTPEFRKRWFVERPEGSLVSERVRQLCQFGQLNLLDSSRAATVGRVDAIFCRNVLIYFGTHARRRVIDIFHQRLYPGGILFLGHSESLLNVSTAFELLHFREDLAYRRPRGREAAS